MRAPPSTRERFSHLPEFSRLYQERQALLELEKRGSIDPAWVKRRLEAVTAEIDQGVAAFAFMHDWDSVRMREDEADE